jgi:LPXTG-site transpeptidase (sortase) family protein
MATTKSLLEQIWRNKFTFLFVYFVVFLLSYLLLVAIDFVPEPVSETEQENNLSTEEAIAEADEQLLPTPALVEEVSAPVDVSPVLPTTLYIERLEKTITVLNPRSRTIADLDEALLSGVVRHPDSAHLMQDGNVFILGHSSYLPNVFNENFQAFNGIQNLKWGDTIEVSSGDKTFVYRVEKVFQARAQEVVVPIAGDERLLTLATCNSFGSTDDRYIVEARQVEVREA